MDYEEKIEKEKRLSEIEVLIDEINDLLNMLGFSHLPNIGSEVYNKMVLLSINFYKNEKMFYKSQLSNIILKYFLNITLNGVNILGECDKYKNNFLSNVSKNINIISSKDFLKNISEYFSKYNNMIDKIRSFDLRKDILTAYTVAIPLIKDNNVPDIILDQITKQLNEELYELNIDTILPNIGEIDNENGKSFHK